MCHNSGEPITVVPQLKRYVRNSSGGVSPRSPNPDLFQTKKCHFSHPFLDLTFKIRSLFSDQNGQSVYPFSDQKVPKFIPFEAAHTYMAYIGGYPTGKEPFPEVRLAENEYPSNATRQTTIKNRKEYEHNFKVMNKWMNEWMNEWRVVDERTTDVPSFQCIFNMRTVSSDANIQRRQWQPLSVHLWAYCTHPNHDVNDVMFEGWPQHRGLRPLLFSNSVVGSFTSHKNQTSVSAVRPDLRFFVLIREQWKV